LNHKTSPPSKGYLLRSEVCKIQNFEGIHQATLESIEYIYNVSILSTQKNFFASTVCELIDAGFEGITIGFLGDFDKIKIKVSI
jgi:hypothetical protein